MNPPPCPRGSIVMKNCSFKPRCESIAAPLKRSGRFPPIMIHMNAIGERSGELEAMLHHVASTYDNQVTIRLQTLTSMLEPLMIVLMGGMAGSIALSILMPLMQINEFIQ